MVSCGQDPLIDPTYQPFVLGDEMPTHGLHGAHESALTFVYEKTVNKSGANAPRLTLRMASVIYTHCPLFLVDLKKCISQFQVCGFKSVLDDEFTTVPAYCLEKNSLPRFI